MNRRPQTAGRWTDRHAEEAWCGTRSWDTCPGLVSIRLVIHSIHTEGALTVHLPLKEADTAPLHPTGTVTHSTGPAAATRKGSPDCHTQAHGTVLQLISTGTRMHMQTHTNCHGHCAQWTSHPQHRDSLSVSLTYTHAHTHTYAHIYTHRHTHVHTDMHTRTRTYTHVHTCTHTHVHTHTSQTSTVLHRHHIYTPHPAATHARLPHSHPWHAQLCAPCTQDTGR